MSDIENHQTPYPKFQANQVLKASDLNDLRYSCVEESYTTRAALIGMGIVCGFNNGSSNTKLLTLKPGYGLTPAGWIIRRENPFNIRLDDTDGTPGTPTPVKVSDLVVSQQDFSDTITYEPTAGSYSLILEVEVPEAPAGGPCDPDNCDQTAFLCEPVVKLTKAPVRLARPPEIAVAESLPRASVDAGGNLQNYDVLLNTFLRPALTDIFGSDPFTPDFDPPDGKPMREKMYMVGRLNEIREEYYQYLLCKMRSRNCAGLAEVEGARNFLVLGYLENDGSEWRWQPEYRDRFISAFDALYAFSTCDQYLDRIRTLIGMPISVPEPTTSPNPPTVEIVTIIDAGDTWATDISGIHIPNWKWKEDYFYRPPIDPPPLVDSRFSGLSPFQYEQPGLALRGHLGFKAEDVQPALETAFAQNKIPIDIAIIKEADITGSSIWLTAKPMGGAYYGGTLGLVKNAQDNVVYDLFLPARGNAVKASEMSSLTTEVQGVKDTVNDLETRVSDAELDSRISQKVDVALSNTDFQSQLNTVKGEADALKFVISQTSAGDIGTTLGELQSLALRVDILEGKQP